MTLFRRRAEARRAHLRGGVARSFDELQQAGVEFWQSAPPGARLDAIWALIVDALGDRRKDWTSTPI